MQSLKPKPIENNLILGYSGKIQGWITFDIAPGSDYLGNIKNLKLFPSNSLERVYASHVLEHVNYNDAKVSLREMYRILKPDGEIFIAVPDLVNISKLLETELAETAIDITFGVNRPVKDWQPQHQYGYTKATLEKVMKDCGFIEIEEFEPFLNDTTQLVINSIKISICFKGKKRSNC
ncbi:MAG: methyltransferase domain-containing protein [Nostocaceae cyanobacterium]|nr:methyltransferase domain-containing protein [Nostocaceae cyanobacterium]